MILYHGSSLEVQRPNLEHSREDIDFGIGFYLTPDIDMAKKWACSKKNSFVSVYDVNISALNTYTFALGYEWLDYVKANRRELGNSDYDAYDILIGPTADDKLFATLQEYLDGQITSEQAIEYLNIAGFSNQYVFKNEESIDKHCTFIKSFEIVGEEKKSIRKATVAERNAALEKLSEVKRLHAAQREKEIRGDVYER